MSDRRPGVRAAPPGPPPLPTWPLLAMFGLVPLWWALGAFYLGWTVFGVVLLALLVTRGRVALPAGTATWLVFLALVLLSVTRLDRVTAYLTFGLRFGFLLTALIVCVYVYTLVREGVPWDKVLRPLGCYWLAVVALGWLGVLMPTFALTTPVEMLLPGNISGERFIQALTHVRANEFNPVSRNPIYRTAAPYPYTNNWGTAYALLVPCVLAYLTSVRTGRFRVALIVSLPLSLVPAFMTLNRGMFLGLGLGLCYLGLRALVRGNARLIASIVGLVLLVWVVSLVVPVQELIDARVSTTDTNVDRMDLYVRTWQAVERSPLLGYGAPNSVDTTLAEEPLGTQGMVWQVLYSHGIPALLAFLLWMVLVAKRLAAAVSPAGQWLSTIPVIALVVIPVYAYIDPNMSIIFFAAGAGLAAVSGPVNRPGSAPAAGATPPVAAPTAPPVRATGAAAVPARATAAVPPPAPAEPLVARAAVPAPRVDPERTGAPVTASASVPRPAGPVDAETTRPSGPGPVPQRTGAPVTASASVPRPAGPVDAETTRPSGPGPVPERTGAPVTASASVPRPAGPVEPGRTGPVEPARAPAPGAPGAPAPTPAPSGATPSGVPSSRPTPPAAQPVAGRAVVAPTAVRPEAAVGHAPQPAAARGVDAPTVIQPVRRDPAAGRADPGAGARPLVREQSPPAQQPAARVPRQIGPPEPARPEPARQEVATLPMRVPAGRPEEPVAGGEGERA
ncbi:O-antigen ligase family protein [Micromonospora psammae]|uniref:O-antigen ligase family protein n=1 Tax=Micromonospora sp. CPCC 205556 TaxID=3122398 RepID=UPI002FF24A1B